MLGKNIVKLHQYDHKNRIDICNNGIKVLQYRKHNGAGDGGSPDPDAGKRRVIETED